MDRRFGPWVSVRLLWPFLAATRARGGDLGLILARAGLRWDEVLEPAAWVSHRTAIDFLACAHVATGPESLGLEAAGWQIALGPDLLEYTASTSANLLEGAEIYQSHARLLHQAVEIAVTVERDRVECSYRWSNLETPPDVIDFTLAWTVLGLHRFAEERPQVIGAEFSYPRPLCLDPRFDAIFGPNVIFGSQRNAVSFDREIYSKAPRRRDPELHAILRRTLERGADERSPRATFRDEVADAVATVLGRAPPSLATIARRLAMSPSTLRGRLRQEGASFSDIVDEVRLGLAQRYLDETNLDTKQIAAILQFSHPNAFLRAFKRWTGVTPKRFRSRSSGDR